MRIVSKIVALALATALLAKGQLALVEACAARDPSARAQSAAHAKDAFESAFRENPLFKPRYEGSLLSIQ